MWIGAALVATSAAAQPPGGWLSLSAPREGQLSLVGPVAVELQLPPPAKKSSLELRVDGVVFPVDGFQLQGRTLRGTLEGLGAGRHRLELEARGKHGASLDSWFELVELENPEQCEVLNSASCLLPFPSSRFLERARTRTGYRVAYGPEALPFSNRLEVPLVIPPKVLETKRADPALFLQNDGFSPTVQVLMNFPQGVDPAASGASRLDETTRTYGTRGLDADSPTLLIDFGRGERVNHWIENDSRVPRVSDPARTVTFLRPGEALLPGRRYVVAVRKLVDKSGAPVEAEPVFAAIRDGRPSDIPAVEETRRRLEPVLRRLAALGVERNELILTFDFVVSSDRSLTHEMLSMRDQAFAWLAEQVEAGVQTFSVGEVISHNESCAPGGRAVWRELKGTFQAPLFLSDDPFDAASVREPSFLQRDARGRPVWSTLTSVPYGISIPCAVFGPDGGVSPQPTLLLGHGLFGNGPDLVHGLAGEAAIGFDFVAGATNFSGLSSPDIRPSLFDSFIVRVLSDVDLFEALPDRLRQGQVHQLLLARMLKQGLFNVDPAFQVGGQGVIDAEADTVYFGASLGGIMGTLFAALTPDVEKLNVDVPAINFSLLLQRATPFIEFQFLLFFVNPDPMEQAIGLGLNHELWVRGEPAGYANHVTGRPLRPLPGSIPKQMLVTVALLDQQVSNLGSQLLGRTLRLGTLEGSVMRGLAGMPDLTGPQDSAYVVYDTGSFDVDNRAHRFFIPPLVNQPPQRNGCDPHGLRATIPASLDQLLSFFAPGGRIENLCADGVCDASQPYEIPGGAAAPCDPQNP
jgi:pimeloyl-ACP methyl ester carboxylesterase